MLFELYIKECFTDKHPHFRGGEIVKHRLFVWYQAKEEAEAEARKGRLRSKWARCRVRHGETARPRGGRGRGGAGAGLDQASATCVTNVTNVTCVTSVTSHVYHVYHVCRIVWAYSLGRGGAGEACSVRAVCEANTAALQLAGDTDTAGAGVEVVEVGTLLLLSHLPLAPPLLQEMVWAARAGRLAAGR